MAVTLLLDTPTKVQVGTDTYTRFDVTIGRNVLVTVAGNCYYHPNGVSLDGQSVDGTEQLKWLGPSMNSLRLAGSGAGSQSLPQPRAVDLDGIRSFAFAGLGAPVDIWLCVVMENVAGGR